MIKLKLTVLFFHLPVHDAATVASFTNEENNYKKWLHFLNL